MKILDIKAFGGLLGLLVAMAALLFLPAWTLDYWQAWVFLAVFGFLCTKKVPLARQLLRSISIRKVISIGLYSLVGHPMYMGGGLSLFVGMSLWLGWSCGLFVFLVITPALKWRILDEEKLLISIGAIHFGNTYRPFHGVYRSAARSPDIFGEFALMESRQELGYDC